MSVPVAALVTRAQARGLPDAAVLTAFLAHCTAQSYVPLLRDEFGRACPCPHTALLASRGGRRCRYTHLIHGAFAVQDWARVSHVVSCAATELESVST